MLNWLGDIFSRGTSFLFNVLYVAMIYFFCYFWTAITFNPKDMAENLKNYGTFIPGSTAELASGRGSIVPKSCSAPNTRICAACWPI